MDQSILRQTATGTPVDVEVGVDPRLRVLLCEDNEGDFMLLKQNLSSVPCTEFEIEWTRTLDESFSALHRNEHDVALVDYRLIGGCGLDILREAVAIDWPGPVIMLTSLSDPSIDITSMKLSAADFLSKDELRPALIERSIRYGMEKKRLELAAAHTNRELLQYICELRRAKQEIDFQNQRIASLAYHLASASQGEGLHERNAVSFVPRVQPGNPGPLGVWHFDAEGRTLMVNDVVLGLLEVREMKDLENRLLSALLSTASRQRFQEALHRVDPQAAITIEVELVGQISGRHSCVVMSLLPPAHDDPHHVFMATVVDITGRRNAENATRYLAKHDSLTHLANRAAFDERLRHDTAIARRNGSLVGLICVDLDRFKEVNDSFGHLAGDRLLQQVARRLGEVTRESDTVARLGGDEFGVIATNLKCEEDIAIVANKISVALDQPFSVRGKEFSSGASVGYAIFPTDCENLEDLFERADSALYRDKHQRAARVAS
jgi:diguanylate cyclase (GGDEF)-like protein